jgi:hypothetical protein
MRLFHKAEDYAAFARALAEGLERYLDDRRSKSKQCFSSSTEHRHFATNVIASIYSAE